MRRVLYVDADREMGGLVSRTFETTGDLEVFQAWSGEEALAIAEKAAIDVIISDYELPGMNGLQLLTGVRSIGLCAPFIFFTRNCTVPFFGNAVYKDVFRFNDRHGREKSRIVKLLRIVYWVTGDPDGVSAAGMRA